jgi:hypothetical protein
MAIYVHHNSQQLGPYTVAEVKSQLASGALSIHDHVWWKGQEGWKPLGVSAVLEPGFKDPGGGVSKKPEGAAGLSQFSVAAVVAGCLFPLSFFSSVPAIVFGHCALVELKENPRRTGRGLALTGLALGYFFTLVSVAIVALWFYFQDQIEAAKYRDAMVHAVVLVPPLPPKAATAVPSPALTNAAPAVTNPAPASTNLDLPIAPATAAPADASTNSAAPR